MPELKFQGNISKIEDSITSEQLAVREKLSNQIIDSMISVLKECRKSTKDFTGIAIVYQRDMPPCFVTTSDNVTQDIGSYKKLGITGVMLQEDGSVSSDPEVLIVDTKAIIGTFEANLRGGNE